MEKMPEEKSQPRVIGLILFVYFIELALYSGAIYLTREATFKVAAVMAYSKWRPFSELQSDFIMGVAFALLATFTFILIRFITYWLKEKNLVGKPRLISTVALLTVLTIASTFVYDNFQEYSQPGNYFDWGFASNRVKGEFPFSPRDTGKMMCRVEDPKNPCEPGTCLVEHLVEVPCTNKDLDLTFRWENRFGYVMKAHVNPDGTRRCSPFEAKNMGDKNVVFIGDSFVYGVGLEDEDTLCWRVREKVHASRPEKFQFINVGQPGANIFSYAKNARYAIDTFEPAAVFMGILITDDAQPFDVNMHYHAARWLPFQIAASILEPQIVLDATTILFDFSFSETVVSHIVRKGLKNVVALAEETGVPIILYLYAGENGPANDFYKYYVHLIDEAADKSNMIYSMGGLSVVSPRGETYIPGDGHPTALGNELLAPFFETELARLIPIRVGAQR